MRGFDILMTVSKEYEQLIDKLVSSGHIGSPEIEKAFRKFDRSEFLPEDQKAFAGEDRPLPIGFDQANSQPFTVSFILSLASPKRGENILDVGTGSGWQAALLSSCVGEEGKVVTVERIKEIADRAKDNLEKFKLISSGNVIAVNGSALDIEPEWPIFDKIVSAAEADSVPEIWKKALAVGGKIVMPVKGRLVVADKISVSEFYIKEYPGFSFVPLVK